MSQQRLADAALVSEMTIQRAEASPQCKLRRTTIVALTEALEKERPLSTSEEGAWLADSGMGSLVKVVRKMIAEQHLALSGNDAESQAHGILSRLTQVHGSRRILAFMESLEALAGNLPSARPFDVNVVHPPVQRQGYTEQVITHYDRESPQAAAVPPITQAAPKRKRA